MHGFANTAVAALEEEWDERGYVSVEERRDFVLRMLGGDNDSRTRSNIPFIFPEYYDGTVEYYPDRKAKVSLIALR